MALPSVTIGGNTQYMNPGIQAGMIGFPSYGGSVMMPQTTYAQPTFQYGGSTVMPATSYVTTTAAPMATTAVDVNADGRADYIVAGTDFNRDGIPDAMERPVTTTYVTQAPTMSYAQPVQTMTLPTTSSMVAYPQTLSTGPFVFYPADQYQAPDAAPASPAKAPASPKRDAAAAKKKKKAGTCGFCCPAKKAPAAKKK